jgi:NADPH-dependent 2,4-dienoyl-CoA reductase/sulfur reductase-like enzyme
VNSASEGSEKSYLRRNTCDHLSDGREGLESPWGLIGSKRTRMERIVIIGGVAGGMSAATRARRMNEQASITVLEKSGHISFANCGLPYFIGGQIKDERSLFLTTPELVSKRYRIDARVQHEVTVIDRVAHRIEGINHATGESFTLPYDKLILAPGASPIIPQMPGIEAENVFVLRNVEDAKRLDDYLAASGAKRAVVVGAGFIGLEMVEALHSRGLRVTVVEKAPHALPPLDNEMSGWVEQELDRHGVAARLGQGLSALVQGCPIWQRGRGWVSDSELGRVIEA